MTAVGSSPQSASLAARMNDADAPAGASPAKYRPLDGRRHLHSRTANPFQVTLEES